MLVEQVPQWESRLSRALGDMKIRYDTGSSPTPTATVTEYLNNLHKIVVALKRRRSSCETRQLIRSGEFAGFEGRVLR